MRTILVLLSLLGGTMAWAEPMAPNTLNGNRFFPSFLTPDPFVNSNTTLGFQVFTGSTQVTVLNEVRDLELAAANPRLDAQIQLIPRLGLLFGVGATALTGTNRESALIYGATTMRQFSLGLLGKLFEEEKWILSLAFGVRNSKVLGISPLASLAAATRRPNNALTGITDEHLTQWNPQLRFAYGFTPLMGLLASAGFVTETSGTNLQPDGGGRFDLSATLNLDLKPTAGVPLGITFTLQDYIPTSSDVDRTTVVKFGLYEAFSEHFNGGIEFGAVNTSGAGSTEFSALIRTYY